jgi:acetyl esterase
MILSVAYRLAPEHRHPAAVEDTLVALRWVGETAATWGGDPARLALGGDSAGANLAAVAANLNATVSEPLSLRALLLLYPVTDHPSAGHLSYTENATGYGLDATVMRWLWGLYAPDVAPHDATVSPLRVASVPDLPSTLVATAEYDVLRDEGVAYVQKLRAAGVAVTHLHASDMTHNFAVNPGTVGRFPQCESTLADVAGWLRTTLSTD